MKKLSLIIAVLFSLCTFAQVEKYLPNPQSPPKLVNDFADLLTPEQEQHLETKLVAFDDSTSNQFVVVTVKDLHDYAAVDFAVALGRKWGVGGKEFNNGLIILVSTGGDAGNRDAFIAPGYGLEGAIPDITANTILNAELIPHLKSGDYYTAFNATTDALIKAAAGEYKAPSGYRKKGAKGGGLSKIIIGLVILFFILSMFGGGNRGGGYMSRRGYRGGLLGPTIFGGLGGGAFGGGSGSGGGGGFGGFGGGSFGGGGAGGSW